jgi:hypothetical protein
VIGHTDSSATNGLTPSQPYQVMTLLDPDHHQIVALSKNNLSNDKAWTGAWAQDDEKWKSWD